MHGLADAKLLESDLRSDVALASVLHPVLLVQRPTLLHFVD